MKTYKELTDMNQKIDDFCHQMKFREVMCEEYCWLFRWSRCSTKNKDGTCDKPERKKNAMETNGGPTGFEG